MMKKEELAVRTASLLRLELEYDQLISKAEFLQTLIAKERTDLESISNPTIEEFFGVTDEKVNDTPQPVIIENTDTLAGVKECLKELSVKTNSRKVSLDILRKFGVEKTADLSEADYSKVCKLALEALNDFLKNKKGIE